MTSTLLKNCGKSEVLNIVQSEKNTQHLNIYNPTKYGLNGFTKTSNTFAQYFYTT